MCASFCKRVRPNTDLYAPEILYLSFREAYESGEIEQFQVQSTGISNFKWTEYLNQTERRIPPMAVQKKFRAVIQPILSMVGVLGLQVANLRRTRDLLLPRLVPSTSAPRADA
jgi:type I restriction enzyme S subunit